MNNNIYFVSLTYKKYSARSLNKENFIVVLMSEGAIDNEQEIKSPPCTNLAVGPSFEVEPSANLF